ncbi:MAG: sulfatase-like hydrolase/transferase [Candidatus Latescibacteria bacterium]|nr:sulfatase-like hydrolase/transferase [Candidatus Latescibacterota bacterium]
MKKRPNILLIISEDNGQDLGCYGDKNVDTPHLDALATAGVRLANAYCTQSVCSPGRASIFTGLYPHQNGQIGLSTHEYSMYGHVPNLPGLLKPLGYRTGLLGKLHVKPFEAFPWDLWWNEPDSISFGQRDIYKTAAVARDFMDAAGDAPFFLTVAARDCHLPFLQQSFGVPADPLQADDVASLPFVGVDTPRIRAHTADYYNCMRRLDKTVGLLMGALRAEGKDEDTLVLFTTDHGAQFSRGKCSCYEGGLRIPMIVRWPGRLQQGRVAEELVSQIDVLPTIMAAVGQEVPEHVAGASLLPLLTGEAAAWRQRIYAEWTSSHAPIYYPQRSIRDQRHKLIVTYRSDRPNPCAQINAGTAAFQKHVEPGTLPHEVEGASAEIRRTYALYDNPPVEELYDLHEDPWEFSNLADDPACRPVRDRLRAELVEWQIQTGDLVRNPSVRAQLDAEHAEITQTYYSVGGRVPADFVWPYLGYLGAESCVRQVL